ncbi:ankyrin repeat-containing domain protein [Usnea florida]
MWYRQREESIPTQLKQREGENALHAAARNNDVSTAEDLIGKGFSTEGYDDRGWTPLHIAAARGNLEVLRCLVAHTGDIDIAGEQMNKDTPLGLAAEYDQADAIEILAAAEANVEARNYCDNTPLMVAALEGCSHAVRKLIQKGAEIDCHNSVESALFLLCGRTNRREDRLEILQMMLQAGACADGTDNRMGWTPLQKAAKWSEEAIVSALLAAGANVDAKEAGSLHTPLYIAIEKNRPSIVRLLLDAGADRNAVFQGNLTPAHVAAKCPNYEIMRMLLEKDVDLSVQSHDTGGTPLHVATGCRHMETVKMLLEAGMDAKIMDTSGRTARRIAEQMHSADLVETFHHFLRHKKLD